MRRRMAMALVLNAACGPVKSADPTTERAPPADATSEGAGTAIAASPEVPTGPASPVLPKTSPQSPVEPPPSSPAASPPPLVLPSGALLAYREGDLSLAFTPPRSVTLLDRREKPCTYELGEGGNMYSGAEIERAWRNREAASAVAQTSAFLSPDDLLVNGEVVGTSGRILWTPICAGFCPKGPPGVTSLLRVLHVLAVNARGVCGDPK